MWQLHSTLHKFNIRSRHKCKPASADVTHSSATEIEQGKKSPVSQLLADEELFWELKWKKVGIEEAVMVFVVHNKYVAMFMHFRSAV